MAHLSGIFIYPVVNLCGVHCECFRSLFPKLSHPRASAPIFLQASTVTGTSLSL